VRIEVLDSRVEFKFFREDISACSVAMVAWREWDWDARECAADSEWALFA
jgi:hypothetical protein